MHAQQQNDRELNDRHVQLFLDYSAFTVQEKTKKNSRWNNKVSNFISLTLCIISNKMYMPPTCKSKVSEANYKLYNIKEVFQFFLKINKN